MKAIVVGAGIGGLVSAIALERAGIDVEIVETATRLGEIGAGLSLWPNAMAALGTLGLETMVAARGIELDIGAIRSRDGRPAFLWDRSTSFEFLGGVPVMLHRAELQSALLEACSNVPLQLGAQAVSVERRPGGCRVVLGNGQTCDADLVVGADGIRSAVRKSLDSADVRYAGLTSWRAVIDRPYPDGSSMWIADGKQFLATALAGQRTYISGLLRLPEGRNRALPDWGSVMRREFTGFDPVVGGAIDDIPEDGYYRDDIYYRPPARRVVWGRAVLVGDAAHPVTPDLGQGGCQAIEDAVTLGHCLQGGVDIDEALRRYESTRLPRVRMVARYSRWIGLVMASRNPLVASNAVRHVLVAWSRPISAAGRVSLRQMARHASRESFLASLPSRPVAQERTPEP